ncbi:ArsR/SmtB family transcription factor [Pengzhenrongella frigida]|uniref:Transcriptional regulator n=1 Tax=Pengzhenrongella frigida TaxID=1259133 RepID=A0A4Q5N0W7_9MICO|nr:metalloregulator ArsR/SmtB family transcription factor [Cellulomonas sp. HLT2-17]RYV51690.1 transcriptional regulator [Cellulomonas sp. HLT2-17]
MVEAIQIEVSRDPADPTLPGPTAVALLQAVADPIRWGVLARLADGPHCVCDLQSHVPIAANLLSYHLRVLRDAGLVVTSRRGRWVDYTLAPDARMRLCAALPLPLPEGGIRP